MQETQVVVVDGKNLVPDAVDQQQPRAVLLEGAVLEQRELAAGFLLEPLKVRAVAVLVAQRVGETVDFCVSPKTKTRDMNRNQSLRLLERVFQVVGVVQPEGVEHEVAPAAVRHGALDLVLVRVGQADAVVAAGAEAPVDDLGLVDAVLLADPVEHARPQPVRARRVRRCRRVVAGARDLDHERGAAHLPEALLPDGQLRPVAVQAGENDDERDLVRRRGVCREVVEARQDVSVALLRMDVRNIYLDHWEFMEPFCHRSESVVTKHDLGLEHTLVPCARLLCRRSRRVAASPTAVWGSGQCDRRQRLAWFVRQLCLAFHFTVRRHKDLQVELRCLFSLARVLGGYGPGHQLLCLGEKA